MSRLAAALLLAITVALPGAARADGPSGDVVFVRGSSLWRLPARATGTPVEIARLPDGAKKVTDLSAARGGAVLLLTVDGVPHWVEPDADAPPTARPLDCPRSGGLSPGGRCVVCAGETDVTVIRLADGTARRRAFAAREVAFLGPDGREILAGDDHGLWALSRRLPQPRRLAPERPLRGLLATPDGRRAVGVFREGGQEILETFRLDGTAVRRRLLQDAVPVAWSADSQWLLAQQGRSACIARGVGGEYKCWRRYHAVALAPDGSYALVTREAEKPDKHAPQDHYDLYWAELAGADTHRPKLRLHNVRGPAVWLP